MGTTTRNTTNMHRAFDYNDENTPIGLTAVQRYAMLLAGGFVSLDQDTEHAGNSCLLYTSPSPRDRQKSRMPSSA